MPHSSAQKAYNKMVGEKKEKQATYEEDQALNAKLDRYWSSAEGARKELDWKWFTYDLWVAGHHYAKWDRNTQQIISQPTVDGKSRLVINKIYSTLRAVRSNVLQNQPKADVIPYSSGNPVSDGTIDTTVQLNQWLGYLHDKLRMKEALRASMWHALKYSVGFWQVLWNEDKQEIQVNVVDPYDLYIDPAARTMDEARFIVLAVRRNLADLMEDPKYKGADWEGIEADSKLAASSLKERILRHERGQGATSSDKGSDGTVIVKEFWYKETGEDGKPRHMLCTKVNDRMIRKPQDVTEETMNRLGGIFKLASDVEPLSLYGTGWVKNLIPLNRQLNRLEASAAEYNDLVNKGRFTADKGAGVRIITNQHGQIIEKKKGFEVNPLPVPPLSAQLQQQIVNVNRYMEDIGSFHEAMQGHTPSGVRSGVAIESLKEADSVNLSELVENTESFLEEVYEYIIQLASVKYQFARDIVTTNHMDQKVYLSLIGEKAEAQPEGATVIPSKAAVDVKITSWLAYTQEGRRQAIERLAQMPQMAQLPPEVILEAYQTGNIADIIKKMVQREQQAADQEVQLETAKAQGSAQAQADIQSQQAQQQAQQQQAQQLTTGAGAEGAIAVIKAVLSGQRPQMPPAVTPEFVEYIATFLEEEQAKGTLAGEDVALLEQYLSQAMLLVRQGGPVDMPMVN